MLPAHAVPDYLDEKVEEVEDNVDEKIPGVLLQAEDYGGVIPLPFYGFSRPSADYFNSNLLLQNLIQCDISTGKNHVYLYDEREQGKGGDALCSLRMRQHIRLHSLRVRDGIEPRICASLMDNCVGQNKSQVLMQFYALISVLFFPTVSAFFFLPGHSHMICDRVVAWNRRRMKGLNLYLPISIAEKMNLTPSVHAEVLKANDSDFPFRVGWSSFLSKYFRKLPTGYTSSYVFEFSKGVLTMRTLCTTPDELAVRIDLLKSTVDYEQTRKTIIKDLFGCEDLANVTMLQLTLPKNQGVELKKSKLKSLAKKYFSIPQKFRNYYPDVTTEIKQLQKDKLKPEVVGGKRKREDKLMNNNKKKRKVGRPKIVKPLRSVTNTPSILTFFSVVSTE